MAGFAHTLCLEKQLQEYPILMLISSLEIEGLRRWLSGKESSFQCRRLGLDPKSQGDPLEKEMATHSSILAWEILWTEKPGGLQSKGLQRVGHN